jgi:hypothetical protein
MGLIKQIQPSTLDQISVLRAELKGISLHKNGEFGKTLTWFDESIVNFLDELSKRIMKNPITRSRPDIIAVAFWIRKSNIQKMQDELTSNSGNWAFKFSPIGKVFHVCPANVDTIFLYSLTISILCGNRNILKISSRMQDAGLMELFNLMSELLTEHEMGEGFVDFIQYKNEEEITQWISKNVDARVIWGGNSTIDKIRSILAAPRCRDISFADRVSLSVFSSKSVLGLNDSGWAEFLNKFDNDAYLFDQLGCSSPQLIYFLGDDLLNETAQKLFHSKVQEWLKAKNTLDAASLASLKLNKILDDTVTDVGNVNIRRIEFGSLVTFIELNQVEDIEQIRTCGGGYFYVRCIRDMGQLEEIQRKKVQTITYWGLDESELTELENLKNGIGIDRIVALGQGLNFDYIWDGYNLFWELSKITRRV